jgi:hypothetical protein
MIPCILLCCMVSGSICFALGSWLNYNRGYGDGWDDSDAFHAMPDAEIRWKLTARGGQLLDDTQEPQSAR